MPRVRRQNIPPQLLSHLLDRVKQRHVSVEHLVLPANWLQTEPEVPQGKWFKCYSGTTVCGEGELIKTFLQPGQVAEGDELK